ncbi:MAG: hypothetical protein WKF71_05710 [Pyrinomonadaceae bacterium]
MRGKVNRMLGVLRLRGPNDIEIEFWDKAVPGHCRLSIFDLGASGHQPMLSPQGDIGIVFNGVIYNFRALYAELEEKGCRFRSQTDAEVLIYGYREWGFDKLVAKVQGKFAV